MDNSPIGIVHFGVILNAVKYETFSRLSRDFLGVAKTKNR